VNRAAASAQNEFEPAPAPLKRITQLPENPPEMYDAHYGTAILYTQLGDKSNALDLLEKAYEQRSLFMTELAIEPAFDRLREESRFQNLLQRVGLEKAAVKDD
jgi:hypothetical protein